MAKDSFAEEMKQHQISWALANGVAPDMLETRKGQVSWVLKKEHRKQNLFDPRWWRYIAGHEHRWVRALNSSQCFAVNVFAPLAEDGDLAKTVWARIYPHRPLDPADTVTVEFEHTPPCAHVWLGESGQQTQVDVFFTVQKNDIPVGHLLVEVKFRSTPDNRLSSGDFRFRPDFVGSTPRNRPSWWCCRRTARDPLPTLSAVISPVMKARRASTCHCSQQIKCAGIRGGDRETPGQQPYAQRCAQAPTPGHVLLDRHDGSQSHHPANIAGTDGEHQQH